MLNLQVEGTEKEFRKNYNITIPFPHPKPLADVKYTLAFEKPVSVMVVGSYALKTLTNMEEGFAIDLAVAMPPVSSIPDSSKSIVVLTLRIRRFYKKRIIEITDISIKERITLLV